MLYGIPKDKYPCDGEKLRIGKKKFTPLINKSKDSIKVELVPEYSDMVK